MNFLTKSPDQCEITINEINDLRLYRDALLDLEDITRNQDVRERLHKEVYDVRYFIKKYYHDEQALSKRSVKPRPKKCLMCAPIMVTRFKNC